MQNAPRPELNRRTAATVQSIRSPLTRVGYRLAKGSAYLLLLQAGRSVFQHDLETMNFQVEGPRVVWRSDGAEEELLADGGTRGELIAIPDVALMRALPSTPLGGQMRHTLRQNLSLAMPVSSGLGALVDGLKSECTATEPCADIASEHYLALLLVQLWRLARVGHDVRDHSPRGLAERFVQLSAHHLYDHWRVQDYAATIGVSRDRLGVAVQRATGLSPQGFLHRELYREACELLAITGLPVGQVAFRLGFQDAAYFSRFFTRESGVRPTQFRQSAKAHRKHESESYASWP